MRQFLNQTTLSAGIAIFSMFFGAGNVIFPLALGQKAGSMSSFATLGLLITAIGGPLLGLFAAILFEGECKKFFYRSGKTPGLFLMLICAALLGPFAVMPRCIVLSYVSLQAYLPGTNLWVFSLLFGFICYVCLSKRSHILPILGKFLSPILLFCLVIIILSGLNTSSQTTVDPMGPVESVVEGLVIGYDTMDLIASIFFASIIWRLLKESLDSSNSTMVRHTTLIASLVGGTLLAIIYVGLIRASALNSHLLSEVAPERLLTELSSILLGPFLGTISNIAVSLACLTTVVGLLMTFADLIQKEFPRLNLSYNGSLLLLIMIMVVFANLGFSGIMMIIHPLVTICYPAIIVLTICNILHKLYGWSEVKVPVWGTFGLTLAFFIGTKIL